MNSFAVLAKTFWGICRFRLGPDDLPNSAALTGVTVLAYAITAILTGLVLLPSMVGVVTGLLDTLIMVALALGLLQIKGLMQRSRQTLSALAGSGTLLNCLSLPLSLWAKFEPVSSGFPQLGQLIMVGWSLAVLANILRRALSVSTPVAAAITIFWIAVVMLAFNIVIPGEQ